MTLPLERQETAAPARAPGIDTHALAAEVIRKADKSHPADLVLRETFHKLRAISRGQSREVSRLVFSYYRWQGWLDPRRRLESQLKRAAELASGFAERPETFSDEKLLTRSLPAWASGEIEVAASWVRAIQAEPILWLRARRGAAGELAAALRQAKACGLPDAVWYFGDQDLFHRKEFQTGRFEIQDISSQAVSILCDPQPGQTWWDACAGEGGKTLHLAELMENKGLIWATDRAEWRLKRLKARAARARCFNYRAAFWDGGERLPTRTRFDGVLVDAPCSGIGTWQRNPHARWTTTPEDVRELAEIQKRLLLHAAAAVKPGGRLVYAACTLSRSETQGVAEDIDAQLAGFEPLPLPDLVQPGRPSAPRRWFWPEDLRGNGMFVAAWRRVAPAP